MKRTATDPMPFNTVGLGPLTSSAELVALTPYTDGYPRSVSASAGQLAMVGEAPQRGLWFGVYEDNGALRWERHVEVHGPQGVFVVTLPDGNLVLVGSTPSEVDYGAAHLDRGVFLMWLDAATGDLLRVVSGLTGQLGGDAVLHVASDVFGRVGVLVNGAFPLDSHEACSLLMFDFDGEYEEIVLQQVDDAFPVSRALALDEGGFVLAAFEEEGIRILRYAESGALEWSHQLRDGRFNALRTGSGVTEVAWSLASPGHYFPRVTRLDAQGEPLWTTNLVAPAPTSFVPHTIAETDEGRPWVAGYTVLVEGGVRTWCELAAFTLEPNDGAIHSTHRNPIEGGTVGPFTAIDLHADGDGHVLSALVNVNAAPTQRALVRLKPGPRKAWNSDLHLPQLEAKPRGVAPDGHGGAYTVCEVPPASLRIARYDKAGLERWDQDLSELASVGGDRAQSIIGLDATDAGALVLIETLTVRDQRGAMLIALDLEGGLRWALPLSTGGSRHYADLVVLPSGSVALAGTQGPEPGRLLGRDLGQGILEARSVEDGALRWEQTFGDAGREVVTAMGSSVSGEIYVLGSSSNAFSRASQMQPRVWAFHPDGRLEWSSPLPDEIEGEARAICGGDGGQAIVCGLGPSGGFVTMIEGRQSQTLQPLAGGEHEPTSVAVDAWGNVLIGGRDGVEDCPFIAKVRVAEGRRVWVTYMGDAMDEDAASFITTDRKGRVWATVVEGLRLTGHTSRIAAVWQLDGV